MDIWFMGALAFFFTLSVISFLCGIIKGRMNLNQSMKEDKGLVCELSHDSYKAMELIGSFLQRREWVCRLNVCYSDYVSIKGRIARVWLKPLNSCRWAFHGKDFNLCTLHRLCNYLGCEMIVRQVGTGEQIKKDDPNRVQTKMREELRRKDLSLLYPYNKKEEDLV